MTSLDLLDPGRLGTRDLCFHYCQTRTERLSTGTQNAGKVETEALLRSYLMYIAKHSKSLMTRACVTTQERMGGMNFYSCSIAKDKGKSS